MMRVALLGLGFMGSTHLKAWKKLPEAELAAVVSDDPVKLGGDLSAVGGNLGRAGERWDFSNVRKYRNVDDCIRDRDLDIVDICLPTHLHASAAIAALRAGKHVLVEKPLALNADEARRMLSEAEESGRVLMCAQVLRFFPEYLAVKDALPRLGPLRSALLRRRCAGPAWARWLADPCASGGGVFDLLIHDVDQCLQLFGKPESVSATGYEDLPKGIDVIDARLHYANGPAVTVTGGWHHPKAYPFSMEYTVVGDEGTVEYSSAGRAPTLYRADGDSEPLPLADRDGFEAEIAYFLECALAGRKPAVCPPEDSGAAVALTLQMVEARRRNGERIPCDL